MFWVKTYILSPTLISHRFPFSHLHILFILLLNFSHDHFKAVGFFPIFLSSIFYLQSHGHTTNTEVKMKVRFILFCCCLSEIAINVELDKEWEQKNKVSQKEVVQEETTRTFLIKPGYCGRNICLYLQTYMLKP